MNARETLRGWPGVGAASVAVLILGCVVYFGFGARSAHPNDAPSGLAFVTTDDGKTFRTASADQLPPFELDGKTAYRAYVFTCDSGKTRWVGYLERYSKEAKAQVAGTRKLEYGKPPALTSAILGGIEIKKPGESDWVKRVDVERAARVADVRCPNQSGRTPEMVAP